MRDFIINPEPYDIQFLQRVAWALSITSPTLFACVENSIREKRGSKPVKVKLEKLEIDKKLEAIVYLGARKV